jgi:YidC/Oxa1 family membrane protein insertase
LIIINGENAIGGCMGCEGWPIIAQVIDILRPILMFFYEFAGNFGVAIILFTIVVKVFLISLTIKQQRSMLEMQKIQPLTKTLQEKYKHDKEKLQMETMKLYKEHKINPLAGCLPMLIQMPILFSMWFVIRGITDNPALVGEMNFMFLGLNLASIPDFSTPNVLWIIPIVAAGTTYLSSKMMQTLNPATTQAEDGKNPMKSMMMFFPIFTGWIAFTFPAGVGLYWIVTNILQAATQWGASTYLKNKKTNSKTEVIEINANKNRSSGKNR